MALHKSTVAVYETHNMQGNDIVAVAAWPEFVCELVILVVWYLIVGNKCIIWDKILSLVFHCLSSDVTMDRYQAIRTLKKNSLWTLPNALIDLKVCHQHELGLPSAFPVNLDVE